MFGPDFFLSQILDRSFVMFKQPVFQAKLILSFDPWGGYIYFGISSLRIYDICVCIPKCAQSLSLRLHLFITDSQVYIVNACMHVCEVCVYFVLICSLKARNYYCFLYKAKKTLAHLFRNIIIHKIILPMLCLDCNL